MNSELYSRQEMMFSKEILNKHIKIFGLGFIGSNLLNTLVKGGFSFFSIIDFDTVKPHNLLNQYYKEENLKESKVNSLQKNIFEGIPKEVRTKLSIYPFELNAKSFLKDYPFEKNEIIIISVDTIEGRKDILKKILERYDENTIYIFVNTSSEIVYTGIFKGQKKILKKMLLEYSAFKKEEYSSGVCGEKSSFFIGNLVSGLVLGELRRISQQNLKSHCREIAIDLKDNYIENNYKWFS